MSGGISGGVNRGIGLGLAIATIATLPFSSGARSSKEGRNREFHFEKYEVF